MTTVIANKAADAEVARFWFDKMTSANCRPNIFTISTLLKNVSGIVPALFGWKACGNTTALAGSRITQINWLKRGSVFVAVRGGPNSDLEVTLFKKSVTSNYSQKWAWLAAQVREQDESSGATC